MHRDLAARNVLVYRHDQVKIGDFGLARDLERNLVYEVRTPRRPLPFKWMAPEAYDDHRFTVFSDV